MSIAEQLIGSWELVLFEYIRDDGSVLHAYGDRPVGLLMYDRTGHVSAQIYAPDRIRFAKGDRRSGTFDEYQQALTGCICYFGTYTVFESDGYVEHFEQGDVFPNAIGTRQRRFFRIDGDCLELHVPPIMLDGQRTTARIVWRRIPEPDAEAR